jgi:TRAP-type uncharacterized transport system fused permease subunit
MGLPVTAFYVVLATLSAPARSLLIAQGQLVDLIAAGALPEQAKAIFMLTAPDAVEALGWPMPEADAWALLGGVPSDSRTQLLQQARDPATLTTALLSAHMIIFWLSQDSHVTPPVCLTAFAAAAIAETRPMATGLTAWKIAKGLYVMPLLFAYTQFLAGDFWLSLWIFAFGTVGIYALTAAISGWMEAPLSWLATGTALLWPTGPTVNVPGFVLFLVLFAFNLWRGRKSRAQPAPAPPGPTARANSLFPETCRCFRAAAQEPLCCSLQAGQLTSLASSAARLSGSSRSRNSTRLRQRQRGLGTSTPSNSRKCAAAPICRVRV